MASERTAAPVWGAEATTSLLLFFGESLPSRRDSFQRPSKNMQETKVKKAEPCFHSNKKQKGPCTQRSKSKQSVGSQSLEQVALNSALRVVWATDSGHQCAVGGGRNGLRSLNENDNSS